MTIPPDPTAGNTATPSFTTSPSQRPQAWTEPDGTPITSAPADLFSAPRSEQLVSNGWTDVQAATLLDHLGREALHASVDRDFSKAWRKDPTTGESTPRFYTVGSPALTRCQYAVMTHPQRSAVLIIDIDKPSHTPGGTVEALHPETHAALTALHQRELSPAWIGINPLNGKAQALWMIDPVYAAKGHTSPNTRLLNVATAELNALLGGDRAFAHQFSRWPLHRSNDPTAYHWHCQHSQIIRLADLIHEVRTMNPNSAREQAKKPQQYASGRERINAAQAARKAAQTLQELEAELPTTAELAPAASGVIDGVRVIWINQHRAARDETAFRHALATAHRLKAKGQPLKDAKIIDAYERAYNIAQAVGADHREPDLPPMRDRLTMARRVRGYVIQGITNPNTSGKTSSNQTSSGRKALATMGRRGGKQAAKRWHDPAHKNYQEAARKPLVEANQRRRVQGSTSRGRILAYVSQYYVDTGRAPTWREIMQETGLSRRTVAYHLAALREASLLPF
jgi:DNA-binding transcriptional ArsR family regulator